MNFMDGMEQRLSDIRGITLKSLLENPSFLQPPLGKGNNEEKDGKKDKEGFLLNGMDGNGGADDVASAFLGPALWEKTPYDDLKLEYMDLDEFLSENGIGSDDMPKLLEKMDNSQGATGGMSPSSSSYESDKDSGQGQRQIAQSLKDALNIPSPTPSPPPHSPASSTATSPEVVIPPDMSPVREPSPVHIEVPFEPTDTDIALATAPGQDSFDPKQCNFTDDELKPQPMIKKSRKIYVPEEQKDEKYWERRRKNNIAAKRSRDARRIKENQIVIRAVYLEKESGALKADILELKKENSTLKKIIASYEKRLNAMKMD